MKESQSISEHFLVISTLTARVDCKIKTVVEMRFDSLWVRAQLEAKRISPTTKWLHHY